MRRSLDFYDFLLWTVAVLFLTLTVPVLPRWFQFSAERKVVTGVLCLLGAAAAWGATHRPSFLRDNASDRADLFDWLMATAGWFFTVQTYRSAIRWWQADQLTIHRTAVVGVLGILAIFSFYCITQRGGLKKLAGMCFLFAGVAFVIGSWKLITHSASPLLFNVPETKEAAYGFVVSGAGFSALGVLTHAIQRQRERRV